MLNWIAKFVWNWNSNGVAGGELACVLGHDLLPLMLLPYMS